jgi:amidase
MGGYGFQASTPGNPIVTLPIGMAGDVPIGVQVVGRIWRDEELLSVCEVLEQLVRGRVPPPAVHAYELPKE